MNIKMLKAAFTGLVLSVSSFANAGLIIENSIGAGEFGQHTFNWAGGNLIIDMFASG
ncbi:MAG: hypothetical protein MJK12_20750 [Colwellia sp.]|nr:hypothetical protein [Colwellia sp.]